MWYENAVIYQLYIRSFRNKNNEQATFKDLFDWIYYFKSLSVDAIWINPFFLHGCKDGGYDITDFYKISSEFGTIEDFQNFVSVCHENKIKVITELVINHISIHSELFQKHPEYFVWKNQKDERLKSEFVSSGPLTKHSNGFYYYHYFYPEQADLNLEKMETKSLIQDVIKFWYDLGVDGFRLDAVSHYVEDFEHGIQTNSTKNFTFCKELVHLINEISNGKLITIAEVNPHTSQIDLEKYKNIFHLVMNFTDEYLGPKFVDFVNNHDRIRINDFSLFQKKMKYKSPFIIYYGDEIGLENKANLENLTYPEIRELYRDIMPHFLTTEQQHKLDLFKKLILLKKIMS